MSLKLLTEHKDYLLLVDTEEINPPNKSFMYLPKYKNIIRFFSKEQIKQWEDEGERVTEGNEEGFYIIAASPKLGDLPLLPELPKQEEDIFDRELNQHRQWLKEAKTMEEQDRIIVQCDTISYMKGMFKVASKKYTEEDIIKAQLDILGKIYSDNKTSDFDSPTFQDIKYEIEKLNKSLQSLSPTLVPTDFEPELDWKDTLLPYRDLSIRQYRVVDGVLQGTYKFKE